MQIEKECVLGAGCLSAALNIREIDNSFSSKVGRIFSRLKTGINKYLSERKDIAYPFSAKKLELDSVQKVEWKKIMDSMKIVGFKDFRGVADKIQNLLSNLDRERDERDVYLKNAYLFCAFLYDCAGDFDLALGSLSQALDYCGSQDGIYTNELEDIFRLAKGISIDLQQKGDVRSGIVDSFLKKVCEKLERDIVSGVDFKQIREKFFSGKDALFIKCLDSLLRGGFQLVRTDVADNSFVNRRRNALQNE